MKKGNTSGATPIVEKQPVNIRLPEIHHLWIVLPLLAATIFFSGRWVYDSWPVNSIEVKGQFSLWKPELLAHELEWLKQESFFFCRFATYLSTG